MAFQFGLNVSVKHLLYKIIDKMQVHCHSGQFRECRKTKKTVTGCWQIEDEIADGQKKWRENCIGL